MRRLCAALGRTALFALASTTGVLVVACDESPIPTEPIAPDESLSLSYTGLHFPPPTSALSPSAPMATSSVVMNANGLAFSTDRAAFNDLCPVLPMEDFEGSLVLDGAGMACSPPLDSSTDDACYAAGEVIEGFQLDVILNEGSLDHYAVVTIGFDGAPSTLVGPNGFEHDTELSFVNATAVGFDLASLWADEFDVEVFGEGGSLGVLTTYASDIPSGGSFVGVVAQEPITRVVIAGTVPPGSGNLAWKGELIDHLTFGICSINQPPTADANGAYTGDEGSTASFDGTGSSDPDGDPLTFEWDFGDPHDPTPGTGPMPSHIYSENGSYTVTLTVTDPSGEASTASTTAEIANVAPVVGLIQTVPEPVVVGTTIDAAAPFTDPGLADTHHAEIRWGDGGVTYLPEGDPNIAFNTATGEGQLSGDHQYTDPGVYTVEFLVGDDDGGVGRSVYEFVVVYDPAGGFATGGGWIDAPGACNVAEWATCEGATGKAHFGFLSKYRPGATAPEPEGRTQFRFKAGDLDFESAGYDWLVVNQGGTRAQFKGWGTINGADDYRFMIWATDGGPDTFRIKIWWEEGTVEHVVYDNLEEQAIGGGQIQVHK